MTANDHDDRDTRSPTDGDKRRPTPKQRRRLLNRRHVFISGIALVSLAVVAVLIVLLLVRVGVVDRYVAGQIKDTFSKYGIRAEIRNFHLTLPPQTVEMQNVEL